MAQSSYDWNVETDALFTPIDELVGAFRSWQRNSEC